MKLVSLKCPECKADLTVDPSRKECFCQYCGTKIMIDNGEQIQTLKTVDEARIREAELQSELKLKQLEVEKMKLEQEQKNIANNQALKIKTCIILAIIALICFSIGKFTKNEHLVWIEYICIIGLIYIGVSLFSNKNKKK